MTAMTFTKTTKTISLQFDYVQQALTQSVDRLRRYCVEVAIPAGTPPESGWPVLFMLDGQAVFDFLTSTPDLLLPPVAIAGIGYDRKLMDVKQGRTFDYTPAIAGVADLRDPRVPERKAGGVEGFLKLLSKEMIPAIERNFPISLQQQAFYGHSYGGLCVLYNLLNERKPFAYHIAISPSLWWHDNYMLTQVDAWLNQHTLQPSRLTMMVGSDEQIRKKPIGVDGITQENRPAGQPTLQQVKALAARLAEVTELQVDFVEISGADHRGALTASIPLVITHVADYFYHNTSYFNV